MGKSLIESSGSPFDPGKVRVCHRDKAESIYLASKIDLNLSIFAGIKLR